MNPFAELPLDERSSILAAARKLMSRSGMEINRRELADEARVAVAALQKHFKSRQHLQSELNDPLGRENHRGLENNVP